MRVAIADDDPFIHEWLEFKLKERGAEIVAQAYCGNDILLQLQRLHDNQRSPDVVVLDIMMSWRPGDDEPEGAVGLIVAERLRRENPGRAVLILSQFLGLAYYRHVVDKCQGRQGLGYLLKRGITFEDLYKVLLRLCKGEHCMDPRVTEGLIRRIGGYLPALIDRELDIARLWPAELSNEEIAAELGFSVKTVERLTTNIYDKLGLRRQGLTARQMRARAMEILGLE